MATYTKELAFEVANALIAEGIKPTISNVRERMGGGSPNDITKWMQEFNARQQKLAIPQQEPLPNDLQQTANSLLSQLLSQTWDIAKTTANEKLAKERQALTDTREQLENEITDSRALAENLYQENEKLKSALQNQQLENETLLKQQIQDIETIAKLDKSIADYQVKIQHLTDSELALKDQVTELLATIAALQNANKQHEIKLAEISGHFAEITKQRDSLQAANDKLIKQLDSSHTQIEKQQVLIDTKASALTDLKAELEIVKAESKNAHIKQGELTGELKAAFTEIKTLRAENKQYQSISIAENHQS